MTYAGATAATGNSIASFDLVNMGSTSCKLFGYPGMQLLGPTHHSLPTHVRRLPALGLQKGPARSVTLTPGGRAVFEAMWEAACAGNCSSLYAGSERVYYLRITAPNDYESHVIGAAVMTHVQGGAVQVGPVYAVSHSN